MKRSWKNRRGKMIDWRKKIFGGGSIEKKRSKSQLTQKKR